MNTIDQLLFGLKKVRSRGDGRWQACCPSHEDNTASLSVSLVEPDGKLLIYCHAGCSFNNIIRCWPGYPEWQHNNSIRCVAAPKRKIVATYPYQTPTGEVLYEKVRYEPKDFQFRKPNPLYGVANAAGLGIQKYLYNVENDLLCPYQLPLLHQAAPNRTFVFNESEKTVDLLVKYGYVATCFPTGAGKTPGIEQLRDLLSGRSVIVAMDDDEPGRKHAYDVAAKLIGYGASVNFCDPFPETSVPTHRDLYDAINGFIQISCKNINSLFNTYMNSHQFSRKWFAVYLSFLSNQIATCRYPENIRLHMQHLMDNHWPKCEGDNANPRTPLDHPR